MVHNHFESIRKQRLEHQSLLLDRGITRRFGFDIERFRNSPIGHSDYGVHGLAQTVKVVGEDHQRGQARGELDVAAGTRKIHSERRAAIIQFDRYGIEFGQVFDGLPLRR